MKRFWTEVTVAGADGGFTVLLDGRRLKTQVKAALTLPTAALAEAVAAEWRAQGDEVDPRTIRLGGLANAAIDKVAGVVDDLARYAETDLLCYRADAPRELVARQAAAWDPLLDWARARFDVHFELASGIMHRPQPAATVARLAEAVRARDPFALVGLSPLVTIGGSLVTALAVAEQAIAPDAAFAVTHLDELWQAERWGEDALAEEAREARRADFLSAARFLELLSG